MESLSRRINPLAASCRGINERHDIAASLRRINARPAKAGSKIPAANIFFKRKNFFYLLHIGRPSIL